ncbi:MAG: hypothetical protein JWN01_630 [Patescibacteria group bacterium]|nr:hypothetical protein [Patescibacteria group bacterium]
MIIVDLAIIGIIVYAAYSGTKRGMVLIGLELGSFIIATGVALAGYHMIGSWVKALTGTSGALSNVAAFILIWILTEIICAVIVRFKVLPRLTRQVQLSLVNQIGGSALNALKSLIIIALALIVFVGMPLSSGTKRTVTDSFLAKTFLASSGQLQNWLAGGLGHDLSESLNFFTVTAEPESQQRIELGYTTTAVTADPHDEAAMLVLVNQERTSRNLLPLSLNTKARAVARAYSRDMFARGYFSHISPEGKSPFDRMKAGDVSYETAGENLALAPTLDLAHQGLMNSPGHRANILNPSYRTVGIGIIDGGPYGLMVTQDFTD